MKSAINEETMARAAGEAWIKQQAQIEHLQAELEQLQGYEVLWVSRAERAERDLALLRNAVLDAGSLRDLCDLQDRVRAAKAPLPVATEAPGVPGRGTIESG